MASRPKKKLSKNIGLHPRNKHSGQYNFDELIKLTPNLAPFITPNRYGNKSINFFNPEAVKILNTALLKYHYGIKHWDIPANYLCPPIPGRADYIHNMADLLAEKYKNNIPKGKNIKCLDIGVGANCVYPIIGSSVYGWSFVGADIDGTAIASASKILKHNPSLKQNIELRLQTSKNQIFKNIIYPTERFDLTICNPPFHSSAEAVMEASTRKIKNLTKKKNIKAVLNFGGKSTELWCKGGEIKFVKDMIFESGKFKTQCLWFSTLISKESNLKSVYKTLNKVQAAHIKTFPMGQGNKVSRVVAWTFLTKTQQEQWKL